MTVGKRARMTSHAHRRADPAPAAPRFLSESECRALVARILRLTNQRGGTQVQLDSTWDSSVRWARNRVATVSDAHKTAVAIARDGGKVTINQTDDVSLAAGVRWAEKLARLSGDYTSIKQFTYAPPDVTYPKTHIWSEPTYAMTSGQRTQVANTLMAKAEQAGMVSAGYLDVRAGSAHLYLPDGRMCYARFTSAECSLTVRDPAGGGSGWAGASSYDWANIDAQKLADIALDKCLRSRNAVRIEPGRYTVILEPQATYDLLKQIIGGVGLSPIPIGVGFPTPDTEWDGPSPYMNWRWESEHFKNFPVQRPFHDGVKDVQTSQWGATAVGVTKVGQRLLDPSITITFDPEDPLLGRVPFTDAGDPYVPVTWWKDGVLKTLAYGRLEGPNPAELRAQPNAGIFRMQGGHASMNDMIATTPRGLLVTRFSEVKVLDPWSILCTGVTRDGLWLIEQGKISHPVKNLRFTESPLFVFNQVESLGVPVPVFAPRLPAIVPPMKVRDFSFTSMVDAI